VNTILEGISHQDPEECLRFSALNLPRRTDIGGSQGFHRGAASDGSPSEFNQFRLLGPRCLVPNLRIWWSEDLKGVRSDCRLQPFHQVVGLSKSADEQDRSDRTFLFTAGDVPYLTFDQCYDLFDHNVKDALHLRRSYP
jgi:hypothetical protein